jgi:hypothetical protein
VAHEPRNGCEGGGRRGHKRYCALWAWHEHATAYKHGDQPPPAVARSRHLSGRLCRNRVRHGER